MDFLIVFWGREHFEIFMKIDDFVCNNIVIEFPFGGKRSLDID